MKAKTSFVAPLFVLILYGLMLASRFLESRLTAAGGNPYLSVIILQILLFLIPAIIFCRLKGVGYAARLNIRLFSPGKFGSLLVGALVLICGTVLLRFAQIWLFRMNDFRFILFDNYRPSDSSGNFLFAIMAFAVVPALTEEILFRGILLTEYNEAGAGAITASVAVSLMSAMLCLNLELFPIRFFASLIFCTVTYVTGSSLAAFLSHLLFNIYGCFGESYLLDAIQDPTNKIISLFTFSLLFLILTVIFLGECEHIFRRMGQSGTPTPSYRLKKTEDGKTPDLSATESEEEKSPSPSGISHSVKIGIEVFFSPTFLLCLLVFAVAVFGFI